MAKRPLNICTVGYYGKGNFGDELFLKTFRQEFAEHTLFPFTSYLDTSQIDAVVIGGGDILIPYAFQPYYFVDALKKHPIWIYGVGIVDAYPPVAKEVDLYLEYTREAQGFVVRDSYSGELAEQLGLHPRVEVAPDVVFAYKEPHYPLGSLSEMSRKVVGICIYSYDDQPIELILNIVTLLDPNQYELLILPVLDQASNTFSDVSICNRLLQKLHQYFPSFRTRILGACELEMTYAVIQKLDMMISFKLHPSLVALRGNVPVFCVSKQKKVRALLERFGLSQFLALPETDYPSLRDQFRSFIERGHELLAGARSEMLTTEHDSSASLSNLRASIEGYFK